MDQGSPVEQDRVIFPSSNASEKPKFIAERGFRGQKEDYVFRKGEWGVGYYRKDVIFDVLTFPISHDIDLNDEKAVTKAREERAHQQDNLKNLIEISRNSQTSLLSNDGSKIYYGSQMTKGFGIQCFDVNSGERMVDYVGHSAGILSLAIDEEDSRLNSGSYDKTIMAWDIAEKAT